jgi:hypothetical protein
MNDKRDKAVVHVSGTLLRRTWYGNERHNCIVVRPAGEERDEVAYVVNQVRFDGPSEMVFNASPREEQDAEGKLVPAAGHVGRLPGFDNSILVYLEADEKDIQVQPNEGDDYVPLDRLKAAVQSDQLKLLTLNPMLEDNC